MKPIDYNTHAQAILEDIMHRQNWGSTVLDELATYLERMVEEIDRAKKVRKAK